MLRISTLLLSLCLICLVACREVPAEKKVKDTVLDIRLDRDPGKIHPIIKPSTSARKVFSLVFLQAADYHPQTLQMIPILLEEIPGKKVAEDGSVTFDLKFRKDARWPNGSPVTAHDYAFSIKTAMHPLVNAPIYRSYLSTISSIQVSDADPHRCTVKVSRDYNLAKETVISMDVYPAYHYDPLGRIEGILLSDLIDTSRIEVIKTDTAQMAFAAAINGMTYSQTNVVGAGPYQVDRYAPEKQIILKEVPNYWGDNYPEIPQLQSDPEQIVMHIIPDINNALTLLKQGDIDLAAGIAGGPFEDLQDSEYAADKLDFYQEEGLRLYYIMLNTSSTELADPDVRIALNMLVDKATIIQSLEAGAATPIHSHIMSRSRYYNRDIAPHTYNPDSAAVLLDRAGWIDSDGDGIRDRLVDGKLIPLRLKTSATPGKLSADIAQILKSDASKIGVDIELITKSYAVFKEENMKTKDYHLALLATSQDLSDYDPYQRYHSDNMYRSTNYSGYRNDELDQVIEDLRQGGSFDKLKPKYDRFQEIIDRDRPVIYLYSPTTKIAISKNWTIDPTIKRPGYLANTISPQ